MPKRNAWKANLNKQAGPNSGGYDSRRAKGGGSSGNMIHCFSCGTEKTRNHFNPTQLAKLAQKGRAPLCLQCSGGAGPSSNSGPRTSSNNASDKKASAPLSTFNANVSSSRSNQGMIRSTVNHNPIPTRACYHCSELKPKFAYNSTQWKKGEYARCQECMNKSLEEDDMDHIHNLTSEKFTYDPDVDISTLPHAAQVAHTNKRNLRRVRTDNNIVTEASTNTTTMRTTNNNRGSREKTPLESMDKVPTKASDYDSDFEEGDDFKDYGPFGYGYGDDDIFYYSTIGSDYTDYQSTVNSSFTSRYDGYSSMSSNTYWEKDSMSIHIHRNKYSQLMDDGYDDYR
jgi:hypothetical protein